VSELESTPPTGSNKFTVYSNSELTYSAHISDGTSSINNKSTINWDFGEGSKKSGLTVKHNYKNTGEYTFKLDVTVKDGGNTITKSATYIVKVVKRPEIKPPEPTPQPEISITISNFKALPKYGNKAAQINLNENLVFTAFVSGTYEKTAKLTKVSWNFGDGTKKSGISVKHGFKKTGWYNLKITATSSLNQQSYNSENTYRIYVVKPGAPKPEISVLISNFEPLKGQGSKSGQVNLKEKLSFTAFVSGSLANKAKITKASWDFGDKTKKTGIKTSHTFKKTGEYVIKLTSTSTYNGKTYSSTDTYNINVVSKPDLSIESMTKNMDKQKKNTNSVIVTIKNRGAEACQDTQVKVYYSASSLKKFSKIVKVKALKPGESTKITIAFKIPYKNRNLLKIIKVDPDNKIDESVKNNNKKNFK
jgi:PKD repeat protein